MNRLQCARCSKTVYPLEELKCLDKTWHKQCFKCEVCNMALNMRNYKGFNKQPYCEAHIPKAKATTVAETPELKRIQENTKIQSNAVYHAEFEKSKGKFTQVADDPETLRIKQNTKIISNVAYHGELEKKAQMEQKRSLSGSENGKVGSGSVSPDGSQYSVSPSKTPTNDTYVEPAAPVVSSTTPYSSRVAQSSTVIFTSDRGPVQTSASRHIGSIADYDPINENYGSVANSGKGTANSYSKQYMSSGNSAVPRGRINQPHHQAMLQPQPQITTVRQPVGRAYRAMYDYTAQDTDEVSFLDGDMILNCVPIDEGWMTGMVQRTGQTGMLPANYVEQVN